MVVPVVYWLETVDQQLLHAVYTVNLSEEDAAKLKGRMLRKRKINLAVLIFGAALFFCGLVLPLLLYLAGATAITDVLEANMGLLIGALGAGFAGIFIALFATNKCVAVAGAYLKALRIAYPGLPAAPYRRDNSYYGIRGEYNPKEYRTGKGNKTLLASLKNGEIDEARARGLLNYALSGREQGRKMLIFSILFGGLLLGLGAYLSANAVQIMDGSADSMVYTILLACGAIMLLAGLRWIAILRNNIAHIEAVRAGYPRLLEYESR